MEPVVPDAVVRELRRSGYSATGFAANYNAHRPRPPAVLIDLLPLVAQIHRPGLVVDLGSGSGLSTRLWAETADSVVGVEPNIAMRRYAASVTRTETVRYVGHHPRRRRCPMDAPTSSRVPNRCTG